MIGTFGEVTFEVSSEKVKTFSDLKRNSSARLASHDLIGRKPLLEFGGPGLETLTFNMSLSAFWGLEPMEEAKTLRQMRDEGIAAPFTLNGEPQGEGLWVMESLSEDWKYIDNNGVPRQIDCQLTLKEYIENTR